MISLPPGFYDPETRLLIGPDGRQLLTPLMHRILTTLAGAQGRIVAYGHMIQQLWPPPREEPDHAENAMKVTISNMRDRMRTVGLDRQTIGTRHHIGYFLAPMPEAPAIVVTEADRAELRALLATHHDRRRASAVLARLLG